MNNYVITEIDDAQKKMSAYVTLLSYRYMNLCVKAELGALLCQGRVGSTHARQCLYRRRFL